MMKNLLKAVFILGPLMLALAGCTPAGTELTETKPIGMGNGMRGGMGSGMRERHHAQIPAEYAGVSSPVPADEQSLENGAALYAVHCASCHGDGGMGDGPAGAALDPAPAAIAHTSQMMGDDYLFWRISEGSGSFNTAMPGWKSILAESSRWDLINYVRALGTGEIKPQSSMGGARYDPALQAAQQAERLAQAVEGKVITQAEADLFNKVHAAIEDYRAANPGFQTGRDPAEREAAILDELVKSQIISQAEAVAFPDIHDRLGASGLMP
jgi:mono/diheme cytochrome c family protein